MTNLQIALSNFTTTRDMRYRIRSGEVTYCTNPLCNTRMVPKKGTKKDFCSYECRDEYYFLQRKGAIYVNRLDDRPRNDWD